MNYEDLARDTMNYAMRCGCSASRVTLYQSEENELEVRNGNLDTLNHSAGVQLNLTLFVDDRYSIMSTNRLQWDELQSFVQRGVEATRFLAPDLCRSLPPKHLLYKGADSNMGLYDDSYHEITVDDRIELAMAMAENLRHDRLVSGSLYLSDGVEHCYMATTDGFEGRVSSTTFAVNATASLTGNGDERSEDYDFFATPFWNGLNGADCVAQALRMSEMKIGAKRIEGGRYDVVVDRRCVSRLLSPLLSALNGAALYQKSSFLIDRKGGRIASPLLSVVDNPLQHGRFGAMLYSREGEALKPLTIIENGVLVNYYISHYYSKKMNVDATRAYSSVLDFDKSDKTTDEMVGGMRNGLYVIGFNGGNSNPVTGDFSFGIEGFVVRNGVVVEPFSEMLLTGNMVDLWSRLAMVSSDPLLYASPGVPSMLFEDICVN